MPRLLARTSRERMRAVMNVKVERIAAKTGNHFIYQFESIDCGTAFVFF